MNTPGEILSRFYRENNLGDDGGQASPYVKIELTKNFSFYFPNFDARRKAVIKHDIHHLLTDYATSFKEECEISAWEVGSGCKKHYAALFIDTSAVMIGIPLYFRSVLKAYARGRRTKNLYHELISTEDALKMEIPALQKLLGLDQHPKNSKPSVADFFSLALFSIFGLVYSILSLLILPFIIFYSIYVAIKNTKS